MKETSLSFRAVPKDMDVIWIAVHLTNDGKFIRDFHFRTANRRTRVWEKLEEKTGRTRKKLYKEGFRVIRARLVPV